MMHKKRSIILMMSVFALSGHAAQPQQVEDAISQAQEALKDAQTWATANELKEATSDVAKALRKRERGDLDEAIEAVEDTVADLNEMKAEKAIQNLGRN